MLFNLSLLWECDYKGVMYRLVHIRNQNDVEIRLEKRSKDRSGTEYWEDVDGMTARSWDGEGASTVNLYEPEELCFDHALRHFLYHIAPEAVF